MTPTQRRILWLMQEHGQRFVACTGDGARTQGFGHWRVEEGGLAIRAYSNPLYFMATKSHERPEPWLAPVERNARGRWYEITDAGRAAAAAIKTEPKAPRANQRSHFGRRY